MTRCNPSIFLIVVALLSCGGSAVAQEVSDLDVRTGRDKTLQMVKTETPPIIDGLMDDVWSTGAVIDDLHQTDPIEYAEPSEKTVVRILYDEDFLYLSAMMYYEDSSMIVANKLIQGASLRYEDKIRVYINPFNDGRNGYVFQTNANGVRTEGILENVTDQNWDWSGIWNAAAERTDYGWFAEIAIPYKTISFNPNSDSWGLSILRSIERITEDMAWTSYNRSVDPSNFGTITGLEGLQQGKGLDVVPGASATYRRDYDPSSSDSDLEPTLDAYYKFTPNLTGALTFNSDFSATNVDARQVQLTRFNIFFPEQRRFFLQEADIFEFGGLDRNGKPFFSRRIGIGPSGEQLDLEAGGKLTGRIGRWNIGALAVQQDGNAGNVPEGGRLVNESELFVARVSANVLGQSKVGGIVTYGNPTGDLDNSLIGADFNYLNTRSFDNITIDGQLWYQQSNTEGVNGDETAWGVKLRSPNQTGWKARVQYQSIGEDFFPALGFVNRRGIKRSDAYLGYTKRFAAGSIVRSLEGGLDWLHITDSDGNLETEIYDLTLARVQNQTGDNASLYFLDTREVLTSPFEIVEGVIIPIGDYANERYGAKIETGGQRLFIFTLGLEDGGFFSGDRSTINTKIEWQPSRHFAGVFEYEYNDIDLLEGAFETQLFRLRTDVAFNAEWAWITTAQYDNQSDLLSVNSRVQWIPQAGRELYFIYNGGWLEEDTRGFQKIGESATVKLNYTFRF